jgi:hypothetical protein
MALKQMLKEQEESKKTQLEEKEEERFDTFGIRYLKKL